MKTLTMSRAQEVAMTIRQQIFAAPKGRMSIAYSWGIPRDSYLCGEELDLYLGCDEQGLCTHTRKVSSLGWLRFKVNGRLFKGTVYVVLDPSDTYTVLLVEIKRKKTTNGLFTTYAELKAEREQVYVDQLVHTIDRFVETPTQA